MKKKTITKILSALLTVVMLLSAVPFGGLAELDLFTSTASAATIVESGKCGDNDNYTLDSDGNLIISGRGKMYEYNHDEFPSPFQGNSKIKTVTIKTGVTSIGRYAFYHCTGLTSVTISDSVTSIGDSAFVECTGLTNVKIGNSVTIIEDWAFYGCYSLTSISISNSVTSVGVAAFKHTAYYNNSNNWENDVLYIDDFLIEANTSISGSYKIKPGTKVIADDAFCNCAKLTSVTLPDSVISIGKEVFGYCGGLTNITIPNSVISIGKDAFSCCGNLKSFTVSANNPNYNCDSYGVLYNKNKTMLLQYPAGNARTSFIIPDSVTSIGYKAFYGCTSLTSITIPDSVTSIGDYAFADFTGLTNITIPDSVVSIGYYAFGCCTSLTSITFSNSVISIGICAFDGCTSLTSVTFSDGVTSIGDFAFDGCTNLKSVTIPSCVKSIGERAFGFDYNYNVGEYETIPNFKIYCYSNSEGLRYAIDNGFTYEIIGSGNTPTPITDTDTDTGIKIYILGDTYSGVVTLKTEKVTSGSSFNIINNIDGKTQASVFSIETFVNGVQTQPKSSVTVKLPIPSGFNPKNCNLYYVNVEENRAENIAFTIEGNYIVFSTNHFSYYAIVETNGDGIILGDVNGDKNINSADALLVLQSSVGSINLTSNKKTAADVNKDNNVNSADALLILQYSVGQISKF